MINESNVFDFYPLGQAIKGGRNKQKATRAVVAEKLGITDRYLAQIENEGVNPGFELFYTLVTMFDVSVDRYFFPDRAPVKSTRRRRLESLMDGFDEQDLIIMEATANGMSKARETRSKADDPPLTYVLTSENI